MENQKALPNYYNCENIMNAEVLVLLSGGIDSTACVNFYSEFGRPQCGLFIDYGQPAAKKELQSAQSISDYYSIPLITAKFGGPKKIKSGFILGRNCFLISTAMLEAPISISVIAIGIHSGTAYEDCSEYFLSEMQKIVDMYSGHQKINLSAPFLNFNKSEIFSYCLDRKVPIELTYSCEKSSVKPCKKCLSCKDREILYART